MRHHETVIDFVFAGMAQFGHMDAGVGSTRDINWLLFYGCQFRGKDYSTKRIRILPESVMSWYDDPHQEGQQVALVRALVNLYPFRPGTLVPVRCR